MYIYVYTYVYMCVCLSVYMNLHVEISERIKPVWEINCNVLMRDTSRACCLTRFRRPGWRQGKYFRRARMPPKRSVVQERLRQRLATHQSESSVCVRVYVCICVGACL